MKKIAFIGLGTMGFHMASHIQLANFDTTVFNRTKLKSNEWNQKFGGHVAESVLKAGEGQEAVFLCLGRDEDVRTTLLGEIGLLQSMKRGSIIVDHTTTSAGLAQEMFHESKKKGIHFMDAPVSGGEVGAKNGTLTVMLGGEIEVYTEIMPVIDCYSKFSKLMGGPGSGQLTKMVNQICLAGLIQGLAEGLNFTEKVELDSKDVIEVISKGAAQSWQMDNRAESMTKDFFDHGFAVDLMRKDLSIAIKEAQKNNLSLEVTSLVDSFYEDIQNMGGGAWDTSSLIRRLKK